MQFINLHVSQIPFFFGDNHVIKSWSKTTQNLFKYGLICQSFTIILRVVCQCDYLLMNYAMLWRFSYCMCNVYNLTFLSLFVLENALLRLSHVSFANFASETRSRIERPHTGESKRFVIFFLQCVTLCTSVAFAASFSTP